MKPFVLFVGGMGVGAVLTWALHPGIPARMRRIRKQVPGDDSRALERKDRELRVHAGSPGETTHPDSLEKRISDEIVEDRVRSALGHVVSHAGSIRVHSMNGVVTLSGPILAHEVDRLVQRVRSVRGVQHIVNRLDVHATSGKVPGLQ